MPGYSGTPLVRKLGFKPGMEILLVAAPEGYADWIQPLPEGARFVTAADQDTGAAHVFATSARNLGEELRHLRQALGPSAFVWVSWPKKAAKVDTDITEDAIRAVALPMGYVDIKVCAVTDVWSGLKLVVRKELR